MITPKPLTKEAFAPFGQVIEMRGDFDFTFNEGRADRWLDMVDMDVDAAGRIGVSLCVSRPITLPYSVTFVENHPLASQAFIPLNERPFLVIVAHEAGGQVQPPEAFLTNGHQGINYARGTWHGVLSPIDQDQNFLIIDRVAGDGDNLEIYEYPEPILISD